MAPGRTRANTPIYSQPVPLEGRRLPSPAKLLETSNKGIWSPPVANNTEFPADLSSPNTPQFTELDESSQQGSYFFSVKDPDYESGETKNEPLRMYESPARSWQGSAHVQETPQSKPREVTYAISAPGSPGLGKKPPRQDSAYYSVRGRDDEMEVDFEVQARQFRARERVMILRGKVLRTRRIRRERKGQLRQLRDHARGALDRLTRKINELVALGRLDQLQIELSPFYDALRLAQDELGPAEDAFDQLENRLDEEELDLEEEEDYFYRHNDVFAIEIPDSRLDDELSPLVKPYHPPETEFTRISLENEKVHEYLAKIEEAERLKEGLDDLETDYYRLSVDANFRKRHDIPISKETASFLKSYPIEYKDALRNLHLVEDALLDLRDECIDAGLFNESEYPYEPRDALYDEVMEAVDEARERLPLRVAADNHKGEVINFGDKRDYVNKWLLEWVPDSTVETMILRSWIYSEYPNVHQSEDLGEDKWADLAMDHWDIDSAGKMANKFFTASKLDAITGEDNTGNLGIISTTRSGLYGSTASLDVALDQERYSDGEEAETSSLPMLNNALELPPIVQSYQQTASADMTPNSHKPEELRPPKLLPVTKASIVSPFNSSSSYTSRALLLSGPPTRAKSAMPQYRTQTTPTLHHRISSSETDLSTLRNDASSIAEPSTPLEGNAPSNDDQDQANHLFMHSNASILSDLFIPLNDVLV